jgi:hypothetical protein
LKVTSSNSLARAVGRGYESNLQQSPTITPQASADANPQQNPLREFFESRKEGPGIWKWIHYFEIYDRHFRKFRGQDVHVLEIGVYSGGSLDMWRDYFGPKATIYGVDIAPECRVYERDRVKIFIGDQADRSFWRETRKNAPAFDIVIDDGGHLPEQQIVSLEELFPFMRPGGVYLCEDVHGGYNPFASYVHGMAHKLNDYVVTHNAPDDNARRYVCECTPFQSAVDSIHLYPYVTVLERNSVLRTELKAPKHGTQWQPYLK